jgi:serine/threonine protein kinase
MRDVGNGRYQLLRELGRGGMGAVWLGHDTMLDREVAVKELMVPGGVPDGERSVYQERVLREARTASRLTDPAVVTVYDLIKEGDQTYIVMELIDAPTLTELVERDGPLGPAAAVTLAGQLLSALEAAHESGVVHRDVKPGNVMVPPRGTAKLTDFGIAQSLDDPRLTATGALIGSPAYMSPERLSGGPASPAWDLWALGATLFFATEGYGPFERDTTHACMLAVMTERPAPRSAPGPLHQLIVGLLDPDPELRMHAPEARQLIEQAAGQVTQPVAARPHGSTRQMDSPPKGPTRRVAEPKTPASPNRWPATPAGLADYQRARIAQVRKRSYVIMVVTALILAWPLWYMLHNSFTGVPGADFSGIGTTTTPPASSENMQPALTVGPDGDIRTDGNLVTTFNDCLRWVPAKGAKAVAKEDKGGCYEPYDVQTMDVDYASFSDKDIPYPPVEELVGKGGTECTRIFQSDRVAAKDRATLRYWVVVPTFEAWKVRTNERGYQVSSRMFYCFLGKADGSKLTEPVLRD